MDKAAKKMQREQEARARKAEREQEREEEAFLDSMDWEKQEKSLLRALKQKGEENWSLKDWSDYLGCESLRIKDARRLRARMSTMPIWDIVEMWVESHYDKEDDELGVGAFAEKGKFPTDEDAAYFCNELSTKLDDLMRYGFPSNEAARICLEYSTRVKGAQDAANEFYNSMVIEGSAVRLSGEFTICPDVYKKAIRKMGGRNAREVTPETNFLVIGEKPSLHEMKEAFKHGVTICCEYSLYEALGMAN